MEQMEQASPPVRFTSDGKPVECRYVLLTLSQNPDAIRRAAWKGRVVNNQCEVGLSEAEHYAAGDPVAVAVTAAVYADGQVVLMNYTDNRDFVLASPLAVLVYGWDVATFEAFGVAFPELDRPEPEATRFDETTTPRPGGNVTAGTMTGDGMILPTYHGDLVVSILDRVRLATGWGTVESWGGGCVIVRPDSEADLPPYYKMVVETLRVHGADIVDQYAWRGDKFPTRADYDHWVAKHKRAIYGGEGADGTADGEWSVSDIRPYVEPAK